MLQAIYNDTNTVRRMNRMFVHFLREFTVPTVKLVRRFSIWPLFFILFSHNESKQRAEGNRQSCLLKFDKQKNSHTHRFEIFVNEFETEFFKFKTVGIIYKQPICAETLFRLHLPRLKFSLPVFNNNTVQNASLL